MISFRQISWVHFYYCYLSNPSFLRLCFFVFLIVVFFHLSSISSVLMALFLAALALSFTYIDLSHDFQ